MSEEGRGEWCHDMAIAPKGSSVSTTHIIKGVEQKYQKSVPDWIWIATEGGVVARCHWSKPVRNDTGRWAGLSDSCKPIAWMWFEKPPHPTMGVSNET